MMERKLTALFALVASVCVGSIAYGLTASSHSPPAASSSPYPLTVSEVASLSDEVFLGTVDEQVGDQGLPLSGPGDAEIPMSQYSVTVRRVLKGSLAKDSEVIVNCFECELQGGAYLFASEENALFSLEGDPIGEDWFVVRRPGLDFKTVGTAAEEKSVVAEYEIAVRDAPNPEDVKIPTD